MTAVEMVVHALAIIGAITVVRTVVTLLIRAVRRGRRTTRQIGRDATRKAQIRRRDERRTAPPARASQQAHPVAHPVTRDLGATFTVSVDGACPDRSGKAGWAWVNEHGQWVAAAESNMTLFAAELTAVVEALEAHAGTTGLIVRTDSKYAHGTVAKWMDGHAARQWRTGNGKEVKNVELIKRAMRARDARRGLGLPDATIVLAPRDTADGAPLTDLWAYACAVRGLRHARNGGTRRWAHDAEHGEFAVDLTRRPAQADLAPAVATV